MIRLALNVSLVLLLCAISAQASITFVAATEASVDATSLTVSVPAGVQDGDLLLLMCTQANGESGSWNSIAGWTEEVVDAPTATAPSKPETSVFSRIANSEPATYACTITNPATDLIAKMVAFRGVDTSTPLDQTSTIAEGSGSSNPDPPSITTVTDGAFVLAVGFMDSNAASSLGIPSGYTDPDGLGLVQKNTSGQGNGCSLAIAYKEIASAGAENPGTFEFTDSDEWGAISLAIRPDVGNGAARRMLIIAKNGRP